MKNLSCDIIADLLPLYADGKCSEYTKKCIIHHTDNCPTCRNLLSDMTANIIGTNTAEISDTKTVDNKIKTVFFKKFLIIACAILLGLDFILGIFFGIFADISFFILFMIICYNTVILCITMYLSFTSRYKVLYVLIPFFIIHLIFYFCIYDIPLLMFYAPAVLGSMAGKIAKR